MASLDGFHTAERLAPEVDLREYVRVLRSRKWLILGVVVVVLGSALAFSLRQTPTYTAEGRVLVKQLPGTPFLNVATEAEVLSSAAIAELAVLELGADVSPERLLERLEVVPVADEASTDVLDVSYSSSDPEFAAAAVNAFSESYIEHRRDTALAGARAEEQALANRVEELRRQLNDLSERIEAARADNRAAEVATLESERTVAAAQLGSLQQQLDTVVASTVGVSGGEILEAAQVPSAPTSPNHVRNGALGLFLGLALGVGLALVRERLEDSFRGREEVERGLGAPVLATVGRYSLPKKGSRLVTLADERSPASEAYRNLRTNLEFTAMQHGARVMLITSPAAAEGKTSTAVNLAATLAATERNVVLVSADLRKPTLETYLAVDRSPGLSDWLLGDVEDLVSIIQRSDVAAVDVVASGAIPSNPAEILTSFRLQEIVSQLTSKYDIVIFDAPPVLPVADAVILASRIGAAVLVLDSSKTGKSAAVHAREQLERVGARVLGVVLNAVEVGTNSYYYESYSSVDDGKGKKGRRRGRRNR